MKHFFPLSLLVCLTVLASCSGTRNMQVNIMRPAAITIPSNIHSMTVLNRSVPIAGAGLESTLTGEMPAQDKELSSECLRGLHETLNTSERFRINRCDSVWLAADGKSLAFGALLPWPVVDSICELYETNALMVLEYFDTDFSVLNPGATAAAAVTSVLNGNTQVEVKGTARAVAGFRIYDPVRKVILYEDRIRYSKTWTNQASNPVEALARLIKKNDALFAVSYDTGYGFAMDIVPLYFWEHRDMYKGKKKGMERGERQALAKDWEGAVKTWTEVYETSPKSKIRARAAFNVALGYEVLGDLQKAQEWVQKAYVEGGKDTALRYSNILDERVREQKKLEEQTTPGF
jgi:hypothetical protein